MVGLVETKLNYQDVVPMAEDGRYKIQKGNRHSKKLGSHVNCKERHDNRKYKDRTEVLQLAVKNNQNAKKRFYISMSHVKGN